MVWSNNFQYSTWNPCGARAGVARVPHGNLKCFSYPTGSVRGPCGTRKGAARRPYGHVRELTQPEFAKIPQGHRMWPYVAVRRPTGPVRAPWVDVRFFVQNSTGTTREQPVRGPGVWCDWGISKMRQCYLVLVRFVWSPCITETWCIIENKTQFNKYANYYCFFLFVGLWTCSIFPYPAGSVPDIRIIVTSHDWVSWCLKSPASRLFIHSLFRVTT